MASSRRVRDRQVSASVTEHLEIDTAAMSMRLRAGFHRTGCSRWSTSRIRSAPRVYLSFDIERNGKISNIELKQPSGIPTLDRSAQRAILASNPLPPLPSDFRGGMRQREFLFRVREVMMKKNICTSLSSVVSHYLCGGVARLLPAFQEPTDPNGQHVLESSASSIAVPEFQPASADPKTIAIDEPL